jgi:hypothetical protein
MSKKFILEGWKSFAEENGVNKKEPMENFDWCSPEEKFYLSDCRDGLEKVEGAKEWLKTYTCAKKEQPFSTGLGEKIVLSGEHSGASFHSILWRYKYLLNNWDTFVYEQKKKVAVTAYKALIPPSYVYRRLLANCAYFLKKNSTQMYDIVQGDWTMYAPEVHSAKTVDEIQRSMAPLVEELDELDREERVHEAERMHRQLISSLEFLYENPVRWFDTEIGCSLSPGHPAKITDRAMDEMENAYPGYKHHSEMVSKAIDRLSAYPWEYRNNRAFMKNFMAEQGVVAGVI